MLAHLLTYFLLFFFAVGPAASSSDVLSFFGGAVVLPRLTWSGTVTVSSSFPLTLQEAVSTPTSSLVTNGGSLIIHNGQLSGAIEATSAASLNLRNVSLSSTASIAALSTSSAGVSAFAIALADGSVIPSSVSLPPTAAIGMTTSILPGLIDASSLTFVGTLCCVAVCSSGTCTLGVTGPSGQALRYLSLTVTRRSGAI
jgi:hypothetical protein